MNITSFHGHFTEFDYAAILINKSYWYRITFARNYRLFVYRTWTIKISIKWYSSCVYFSFIYGSRANLIGSPFPSYIKVWTKTKTSAISKVSRPCPHSTVWTWCPTHGVFFLNICITQYKKRPEEIAPAGHMEVGVSACCFFTVSSRSSQRVSECQFCYLERKIAIFGRCKTKSNSGGSTKECLAICQTCTLFVYSPVRSL